MSASSHALQFHYGDRVLCTDQNSRWYGEVGTVVVMNKQGLGVRFDRDDAPPSTGRWIKKSVARQVLAPDQFRPWLRALHVHHNYAARNVTIPVGSREDGLRHLVLTGRNGSGKSTTLRALWEELRHGSRGMALARARIQHPDPDQQARAIETIVGTSACVEPEYWSDLLDVEIQRRSGQLLAVYVPASRNLSVSAVTAPDAVRWSAVFAQDEPSRWLMQYLVDRRTQQAFAAEEGRGADVEKHREWFTRLEKVLRELLDEPSLSLIFQHSDYRFDLRFRENGVARFDCLPDGYASLIRIWADLALALEAARGTHPKVSAWHGIALIDEIEAHLHVELQETVLPSLTKLFPEFQFIVTTHSPAVLSSVDNATIFDLTKKKSLASADLQGVAYGAIMTGHFGISSDMDLDTTRMLERWRRLIHQSHRTPADETECSKLGAELSARSPRLGLEVWSATERPRLEHLLQAQEHDQSPATSRAPAVAGAA